MFDDLLPASLLTKLSSVFAKESPFWRETGYLREGGSGYFSFWSPLSSNGSGDDNNLISQTIEQFLLPAVNNHLKRHGDNRKIVGAEWWAHTRQIDAPPLSNLGHRLHFDTDEGSLDEFIDDCEKMGVSPSKVKNGGGVDGFGGVKSPVVSSVFYLDVHEEEDMRGGATVIFDQQVESEKMADVCWVSKPRNGGFLIFDGGLLHGVFPCPCPRSPAKGKSNAKRIPSKNRLTFMVGFYDRDIPAEATDREERRERAKRKRKRKLNDDDNGNDDDDDDDDDEDDGDNGKRTESEVSHMNEVFRALSHHRVMEEDHVNNCPPLRLAANISIGRRPRAQYCSLPTGSLQQFAGK